MLRSLDGASLFLLVFCFFYSARYFFLEILVGITASYLFRFFGMYERGGVIIIVGILVNMVACTAQKKGPSGQFYFWSCCRDKKNSKKKQQCNI